MSSYVQVTKEEGAALVTIDHPPLNVMSAEVVEELLAAFQELERDKNIVAVVLTGAGSTAFMAGADIKEFPSWMGKKGIKEDFMKNHEFLYKLDVFPKPTIAVLNGLTYGGGCELALAFDMIIAEQHASIALPEIKLGLFPGGGGTQRLPRAIGSALAKEMMYTGDAISAERAERIGLVNAVVPRGEGIAKGMELAKRISRHSLPALSKIKKAVDAGLQTTLQKGLEYEAELFEEVFQTEDVREGVTAFFEKRKPVFVHK
ncbi:enoyl-CoA hydratase [Bacillus lacus]|uniref:Enoyl-CoA hydratase n=1 Tax=Metabacillus lacus TaxID=1983721 RepID=A0A7X2IZ90_9BACI|nr:enoyl-CoA hydratase [Metabacillus lacus]MRX72237.1 enoyl-CoA hydratase [Metabacillus lacus]